MKFIIGLLGSLMLVGCGSTIEKTIVVTEVRYEAITISKEYMKPIRTEELFTREAYINMSDDERRMALIEAIVDRNAIINSLNNRLEFIAKESDRLRDYVNSKITEPTISESSKVQ